MFNHAPSQVQKIQDLILERKFNTAKKLIFKKATTADHKNKIFLLLGALLAGMSMSNPTDLKLQETLTDFSKYIV
jgi:hypothetical protein